jgi:hypothetical protein
MPYWTFLLQTAASDPVVRRHDTQTVASAAGVVPLGWLALFEPADLHPIVPEGETQRVLTLATSVRTARDRLHRRGERLRELVQRPLAEHLDLLGETLASRPEGAGLQVWLHELVYPFPDDAEARGLLTLALSAFDTPSPQALAALGDLLLVEPSAATPRFRFDLDVAVAKTVGGLEGRRPPERADALAPDLAALSAGSARLDELGLGFTGLHQGLRDAARDLAGPPSADAVAAAALEAWEADTLTIEDALRHQPLEVRRAFIAELAARGVPLPTLPAEADPQLSAALVALALFGGRPAWTAAVPAALESADVRVRAGLAFTYPPSDPFDDDDDEVAPLDAVWERLATDPEPRVRWAACANPRSPLKPDDDPHPAVRALRRSAPLLELLALASRDEPLGLATALFRPHTPMLVHREALRTLGIPLETDL